MTAHPPPERHAKLASALRRWEESNYCKRPLGSPAARDKLNRNDSIKALVISNRLGREMGMALADELCGSLSITLGVAPQAFVERDVEDYGYYRLSAKTSI